MTHPTVHVILQFKQSHHSTPAQAELAILQDGRTVLHISSGSVGIAGALPLSGSGINIEGPISGSGGLNIGPGGGLNIAEADAIDFTRTLVYNSSTGEVRAQSSNELGGVTGITAAEPNLSSSVDAGTHTIHMNSSLTDITNLHISGTAETPGIISGSGIVLKGASGSFGDDGIERYDDGSRVSVQEITASNLIVQDSSIFNGTFLFSGLDFSVQNASSFSGSNQFGSGSLPSDAFHEFTGSVDITGSLEVTGPVEFNDNVNIDGDLSVDGTSNLDNTDIDGTLDVDGNVTLGSDNADTLTVNAVSTFNENVTLDTANLIVGGQITGSKLRVTNLPTITEFGSNDAFFIISGSDGNVSKAALSTLSLSDLSFTGGDGIVVDGSTISVDSASMDLHFRSASLTMVDGDVKFADGDDDGVFTATIQANAVEDSMIDFIADDAGSSIADGQILVGSGSAANKQFFKRSLSGVITIDSEGVTAFTEAANVGTANETSASHITSASAGEFSILLTDSTTGNVTQSLKVDGTSNSDFKYHTGTNTLTVGGTTIGTDVTIAGNLSVQGTTTTINSETIAVEDNFIELNSNIVGTINTANGAGNEQDAGFSVLRGNQATASFFWDESSNRWALSQGDINGVPNVDDSGNYTLSPDAFVMYMYTDHSNATPPDHLGGDADADWGGYGSIDSATKQGAVYINTNGDIFIYS